MNFLLYVSVRDSWKNGIEIVHKGKKYFGCSICESFYLILQASLVTKLEDIISIVSILKAIESLKFLLRTIYILLKIVKIVIVEKNRIFL